MTRQQPGRYVPPRQHENSEELHEEMTPDDIVHALQHLAFSRGFGQVTLDRQVRDFLSALFESADGAGSQVRNFVDK
jgi:hypothetical protein